jgi:hypothetical protein
MSKTRQNPPKATRPAKKQLARTSPSQGRHRTPARLVYPVPVVSDEPDALEEADTADLIDEYQACAA